MKLHYFAALVIFGALLFGGGATAHSQQKSTFFGPSQGLPTRLFGSTNCRGCVDECAPACDCDSGCGQKEVWGGPVFRGPKCTSVMSGPLQKSCDCDVEQKSVVQKTVVQKSVVQKGESDGCDRSCGPNPIVRALSKLDGAVKGLFCSKSNCCQPCPDLCCNMPKSCTGCGGKTDSACGSGCGPGDDGSPTEFGTPSPYNDLEAPVFDGNPFEDDAVQPPPPTPSEVSHPLRPRPLLVGPVAVTEVTSPFRLQTPPRLALQTPIRIRPVDASPLQKTPQLAKSILDRGNSTSSRRYSERQSTCRLTSAQTDVIDR